MFTGFMVDASNIMTFESVGNMSSDVKYSIEFWIFKPKSNGEQVFLHLIHNIIRLLWQQNYLIDLFYYISSLTVLSTSRTYWFIDQLALFTSFCMMRHESLYLFSTFCKHPYESARVCLTLSESVYFSLTLLTFSLLRLTLSDPVWICLYGIDFVHLM